MLAGGQSLIPLMKLRFAAPDALVDINGVEGLDGLREEGGELQIGALVRHRDCERSELLKGRFGVLGDAAPQISDPIVRNRGTVAGSLAHAEPQGDWGSALMAAEARVVVRSPGARREIAVEDLIRARSRQSSSRRDHHGGARARPGPERRVTLSADGRELRGRGAARATVESSLASVNGGTRVDIVTDLSLTGPAAQYGRGLVADVSSQRAEEAVAEAGKPVGGLRLGLAAIWRRVRRLFRRR